MDQKDLDRFIEAANAFYNGEELIMTDKEYDELEVEFLKTGRKLVEHIDILTKADKLPHDNLPGLDKIKPKGEYSEELESIYRRILEANGEVIIMPKYDGSSIVGYYSNGSLKCILSSVKGNMGINQTNKFKHFFPQTVDPEIKSIQCEAVIDMKDSTDEKIRNKANGLVNSKVMQHEVNELISLKAFRINYVDDHYDFHRMMLDLRTLELRASDSGRIIFSPACQYQLEEVATDEVTPIIDSNYGEKFLIDGFVLYAPNRVVGVKFYYTDFKDTEVTKVGWQYSIDKESWTPVVWFKTVILNGSTVSKASPGGVSNLMRRGLGVGAKVRVIKAGNTIPQVLKVHEKSDVYDTPDCNACGGTLEQFGSTLKCVNPDCEKKEAMRLKKLRDTFGATKSLETQDEFRDVFSDPKNTNNIVKVLLNMDRLTKSLGFTEVGCKTLINLLTEDSTIRDEHFNELMKIVLPPLSGIQSKQYKMNYKSTISAIAARFQELE